MKTIKTLFVFCCLLFFAGSTTWAQSNAAQREKVRKEINKIAKKTARVGKIGIKKITIDNRTKRVTIYATDALSYLPFRYELIDDIYDSVKPLFTKEEQSYKFRLITGGVPIEDLVPNFYRDKHIDESRKFKHQPRSQLVKNISKPYSIKHGLSKRHIALWQSHGWYYDQKTARWRWQRARVFQTVEDLYTQSFVLPYLVPMLENAGANVLLPRERDIQINEVIVDNDTSSYQSEYIETNNAESWENTLDAGFANLQAFYIENENPFKMGSYKRIKTVTNKEEESLAYWIPDIPKRGEYAVYVSYKSIDNSCKAAKYTVSHKGGESQFIVDQTMGGGTWIYLGTFLFDQGLNDTHGVQLSNHADTESTYITADAVKFGGGIGNIARRPNPLGLEPTNTKSSEEQVKERYIIPAVEYEYEVSGYPRFTEGARYWMQWAGIETDIYDRNENKNDYVDDYSSRGYWVNYIAGQSSVLPARSGLKIPIDLAFAFHSDAGTLKGDSIVGTLGIFRTKSEDKEVYTNKVSRYAARDLTDLIMTNIVNDIRTSFNDTTWTRRGLWNKSYSEARVPEVPTMLLELLSHQNFADMRYGLDPRFRFVVSRAIYKGMLKFIASQSNSKYVVQPLPIEQFSAEFLSEQEVELKWKPVKDPIEPTATAQKYIVYTRINDGGFDNGAIIESPSCVIDIEQNKIYSFKIAALNDGGESFPSEILSIYRHLNSTNTVLIVNAFDRISAPASFRHGNEVAGFANNIDHGVPYKYDIGYTGLQYEHRLGIPWMDDDSPGSGASHANYADKVIAGNSFDYPALHGKAIAENGFSFVSCSAKAVEKGEVDLNKYKIIDIILGKQRQTKIGPQKEAAQFKTFTREMQTALNNYSKNGGNVFVSGAFIGTDLWDSDKVFESDKNFAQNVLKYKWRTHMAATDGRVKGVKSAIMPQCKTYNYHNTLNDESYIVEAPDGIEPADSIGWIIMRYPENNVSAGIAYQDSIYKTCVLGFPFEAIKTEEDRNDLMKNILYFFTGQ